MRENLKSIHHKKKKVIIWYMIEMFANAMVAIILQYISILHNGVCYLYLIKLGAKNKEKRQKI